MTCPICFMADLNVFTRATEAARVVPSVTAHGRRVDVIACATIYACPVCEFIGTKDDTRRMTA